MHEFELVGVAKFGDVDTIGSATMAIFDVREAQRMLGKDGYDTISVAGRDGVSAQRLIDEIGPLLPANAQVRTAAEQADADKKGVAEFVGLHPLRAARLRRDRALRRRVRDLQHALDHGRAAHP